MLDGIKLITGCNTSELQQRIDDFLFCEDYIIKSCEVQVVKKAGEVFLLATIVYNEQ